MTDKAPPKPSASVETRLQKLEADNAKIKALMRANGWTVKD